MNEIDIRTYFQALTHALNTVDETALTDATAILDEAYRQEHVIFVVGNGQSATTASAFALDLTKQTITASMSRRFRIIALTDNTAAITAWANDLDYTSIFTEQLKGLYKPGDILLAISASGNSPNILDACKWVREQGGRVIGLTGFAGGQLASHTDACVIVCIDNFGHIETAHIAILHYWVDLFRARLAR